MTPNERALRGSLVIIALFLIAFAFVPIRETIVLFVVILSIYLGGGLFRYRDTK